MSPLSSKKGSSRNVIRRESVLVMVSGNDSGSASSLIKFKRKRNKTEAEVQSEITNKRYETMCYNATFRVQENQQFEKEKKKQIYDKI